MWYLDDGTIAGSPNDVLKELRIIIEKANEIGLTLNHQKCEMQMSILGPHSLEEKKDLLELFNNTSPGIQGIETNKAFLIGCPLTAVVYLDRKINDLKRVTNKLKNISAHSAFFLLRMSITIPRLIFFLRVNLMWRNFTGLKRYDEVLKESLESSILKIQLTLRAWSESSLPIKMGGIGIRHATEMTTPCFLSSIYDVSDLLDKLLSEPYGQIDPAR